MDIELDQTFVAHFQEEGLASFSIRDIGALHDLVDCERLFVERAHDIFLAALSRWASIFLTHIFFVQAVSVAHCLSEPYFAIKLLDLAAHIWRNRLKIDFHFLDLAGEYVRRFII